MRSAASHSRCGLVNVPRRRAVTLLEVLLATGLVVLLISMTLGFYFSSLHTRDAVLKKAHRLRIAQSVQERISREIRQASTLTTQNRVGIQGGADRIRLWTLRVPTREPIEYQRHPEDLEPSACDLMRVEYRIVQHPQIEHPDGFLLPLGLARVEILAPKLPTGTQPVDQTANESLADGESGDDQNTGEGAGLGPGLSIGGSGLSAAPTSSEEDSLFDETNENKVEDDIQWEELYSPEIRWLRFCYYDGKKWWPDWDVRGENPLPQIVQVTIGFEPHCAAGELPELASEEEKFCGCMNKDIGQDTMDECEPLPADTFTMQVRVPEADPFFRSRVARETVHMLNQIGS